MRHDSCMLKHHQQDSKLHVSTTPHNKQYANFAVPHNTVMCRLRINIPYKMVKYVCTVFMPWGSPWVKVRGAMDI